MVAENPLFEDIRITRVIQKATCVHPGCMVFIVERAIGILCGAGTARVWAGGGSNAFGWVCGPQLCGVFRGGVLAWKGINNSRGS